MSASTGSGPPPWLVRLIVVKLVLIVLITGAVVWWASR